MNSRFKNCKTALGSGKEYRETFEEVYIQVVTDCFQFTRSVDIFAVS